MKAFVSMLLLAACTPIVMGSQEQQRHGKSQEAAESSCPDTHAWTGKYVNYSYGFSVVIPEGYKGFWNSAVCVAGPDGCTCMSDHGRIIPLTAEPYEPERHIEVFASYGADLDELTVKQAVDKRLERIRKRSREGSVSVLKQSTITLAGLRSQRVLVRYYDEKLNQMMVEDFVEAIRRRSVQYSLYLRTTEKAYTHDRSVFDNVIATFTLRRLE